MSKLFIIMVGLPARGKSTIALRLLEAFDAEGIKTRIFNNGELRRSHLGADSSLPDFYHPENEDGRAKRERLAYMSATAAKAFMRDGGQVAILDATNGSPSRREFLESMLREAPILYVECVNNNPELIAASVERKARLPEFSFLSRDEAVASFMERISYYEHIYVPPKGACCYVVVDTLHNTVIEEHVPARLPYYLRVRDVLVSGWVRELFLVRHGESLFNVEGRIGGDAPLTELGHAQARALALEFDRQSIPYIFTSKRQRARQTATPLKERHSEAVVIELDELDEIDAGICDGMRYEDIRKEMPAEYAARAKDKYGYAYPGGEGYASMRDRVERGFLKALFLSGGQPGIVIVGHQAVNRSILSLFLYRRMEDIPYTYVPQDQYFRISATYRQKLVEQVRFSAPLPVQGE